MKYLWELLKLFRKEKYPNLKSIAPQSYVEGLRMNGFSISDVNFAEERLLETQENGGIIAFPNPLEGEAILLRERLNTFVIAELSEYPKASFIIGNFIEGSYTSKFGIIFDEHSNCIEICGVSFGIVNEIAETLCKELNLKSVLLKDYQTKNMYIYTNILEAT